MGRAVSTTSWPLSLRIEEQIFTALSFALETFRVSSRFTIPIFNLGFSEKILKFNGVKARCGSNLWDYIWL